MKKREFNMKNIALLIAGAIIMVWGLENLQVIFGLLGVLIGFLFPFILGFAIAFLINIPLRFIEKGLIKLFSSGKRKPNLKVIRPFSILIALALIISVIAGVTFVVMPQIGSTIMSIKDEIPMFMKKCEETMTHLSQNMPDVGAIINELGIDLEKITREFTVFLSNLGGKILSSSISAASSFFSGVVNFFIAFVFSMYILTGKEKLGSQVKHVLEAYLTDKRVAKINRVAKLVDETFSSFFAGQCLEAVILGLMFFVGMSLFKFPYAVLISTLVGFMALIPVFGAFVGCIVGALLILVVDPIKALWFVGFFLVMQQIEGNLIYPKVVGNSVGLPAIWVLVAVTLGAGMMGVTGMLLFIPGSSVIYTLLREDVRKKIISKRNKIAIEQSL